MRIKGLHIENFKSLVDLELKDLKPFCAFVGPNASGKSNIFEALEFSNYATKYPNEAVTLFGGGQQVFTYRKDSYWQPDSLSFKFNFADGIEISFVADHPGASELKPFLIGSVLAEPDGGIDPLPFFEIRNLEKRREFISQWSRIGKRYENDYDQFIDNFLRVFVGKSKLNRIPGSNGKRLFSDASNLAQIIGLIFEDKAKRSDFIEWVSIIIPEFKNIEVRKSNLDNSYDFFIYEKGSEKPFPKSLISDGTYNVLALLAAVYQDNQPQFLCIEDPENGLHPQAIEFLVDFFREKCEEEGHHIWLNTHSQTLVRCLEIDEIILVNKVDGATKAKQLTKEDNINIRTDEAWLSNALGGGVLWSK